MTPANLAAEYLKKDLGKLAKWCAKWRIKLNPEKTKYNILQVANCDKGRACFIFIRTTFSESVINKIQIVHNSFILAFRLRKCVSARLTHEASEFPYVRGRLIKVGQNHLAMSMQTPSLSIQSIQLGTT